MSASIKICGLRTAESLETAITAGADYFGLVFFPPSPRNITISDAAVLAAAAAGRIKCVALTVDASDDELAVIVSEVKPDMIQLHGAEPPERTREIRQRYECPVIKSVSVREAGDVEQAVAYQDVADLILFDAKPPKGAALPGGNGLAFDWRILEPVRWRQRFMLAGGLTPANVAEAIRLTGASVVDVSSGVERAPGEKDPRLIQEFIAAAKNAALEEAADG